MEATTTATVAAGPAGTTTTPDLQSAGGPSGVQTGGAPQQTGAQTQTVDWTSALPDTAKNFALAKGFKDPASVLDSYQNLEKLMGGPREKLLRIPDKSDDPQWGDIYSKLGRPADAKEYAFPVPEGMTGNENMTKNMKDAFYKAGLSKGQGDAIVKTWNEQMQAVIQQENAQASQKTTAEKTALRKEWGAAFDQNLKVAGSGATKLGLDPATIGKLESALGYSATMKMLTRIGEGIGEHGFVTGESGQLQGALTPEMAQAEIAELKKDKAWVSKYAAGDRESFKQLERLMKFAYPDMDTGTVW